MDELQFQSGRSKLKREAKESENSFFFFFIKQLRRGVLWFAAVFSAAVVLFKVQRQQLDQRTDSARLAGCAEHRCFLTKRETKADRDAGRLCAPFVPRCCLSPTSRPENEEDGRIMFG